MTDQTNNSSYWLDVANVAQQALAAAEDEWIKAYNCSDERVRTLAARVISGARDLRDAAMEIRNRLSMMEAANARN